MRPRPSSRGGASACGPETSGAADTRTICSTRGSRALRPAGGGCQADRRGDGLLPASSVGRKSDRVRLGRQRNRKRGGDRVRQMTASHPRRDPAPRLAACRLPRRSAASSDRGAVLRPRARRSRSRWVSTSCTAIRSSRKPGCPRLSDQQLSVSTAQVVGSRLLQHCRAAHQVPHDRPAVVRPPSRSTAARARHATRRCLGDAAGSFQSSLRPPP